MPNSFKVLCAVPARRQPPGPSCICVRGQLGSAQRLATGVVSTAPAGAAAGAHAEPEATARHAQPTTLVGGAAAPADGKTLLAVI